MLRNYLFRLLIFLIAVTSVSCSQEQANSDSSEDAAYPKLPIGMNLRETNYYSSGVPFNDLMKTASSMLTFDTSGSDTSWDTETLDSIPRDNQGWPLFLPVNVEGRPQGVRLLVNNTVPGPHVLLHDGVGEYEWHNISTQKRGGRTEILFNGQGGHVYLEIRNSKKDNPLRNMRVIPAEFADSEANMPLFRQVYLDGLRSFHCLRFMEWTRTNNSDQVHWEDRPTPQFYTQGTDAGISLEYAIELANTLRSDAWFCVPHRATEDYIRQMARLIRENLDADLRCYIEYSNEVWNWQFDQAHWVVHNGISPQWSGGYREDTRTSERTIEEGLAAINATPGDHPEKDAFMMARVFRAFSDVFKGQEHRLVRVAGVQHAWIDNTRRILEYLFHTDGVGCDVIASGGYFGFGEDDHRKWQQMNPEEVDTEMVLTASRQHAEDNEWLWTLETAGYARKFGVEFVVYEGGQHMQPWRQQEWAYNQAVWDAQVASGMYALYLENFRRHSSPRVACTLFMAYCYLGARESRYGSWGHLESLEQLGENNLLDTAPKYQALLDANAPRVHPRY